jgi:hypothetical protein
MNSHKKGIWLYMIMYIPCKKAFLLHPFIDMRVHDRYENEHKTVCFSKEN